MIVKVTKVIHEALHAQIDQLQRKIDLQTKSSSARLAVVDTVITNLIERQATQTECLSYFLENFSFNKNNIGITAAAEYYFQKPIEKLSEKERIGLILLLKNPLHYHPN